MSVEAVNFIRVEEQIRRQSKAEFDIFEREKHKLSKIILNDLMKEQLEDLVVECFKNELSREQEAVKTHLQRRHNEIKMIDEQEKNIIKKLQVIKDNVSELSAREKLEEKKESVGELSAREMAENSGYGEIEPIIASPDPLDALRAALEHSFSENNSPEMRRLSHMSRRSSSIKSNRNIFKGKRNPSIISGSSGSSKKSFLPLKVTSSKRKQELKNVMMKEIALNEYSESP